MPKTTCPPLPLHGVFALAKPSGPTSMSLLTRLKPLFSSSRLFMAADQLEQLDKSLASSSRKKLAYPGPTLPGERTGKDRNKGKARGERTNWKKVSKMYVKLGSGGTLDPLADGVLIVGVGNGTKDLPQFLNCTKTYRTTGLLGCETDSYDAEGAIARLAPWKHVTRALLLQNLERFRGEIMQTPPIYSALKIDGKALYEYARQNIPLPRPIESRKVTISAIDLTAFTPSTEHRFKFPEKRLDEVQVAERQKMLALVASSTEGANLVEVNGSKELSTTSVQPPSSAEADEAEQSAEAEVTTGDEIPPTFELEMTVSSGTYVRSVVHDLGIAVGSAAHVVVLTRTRQGAFVLDDRNEVASPEQEIDRGLRCVDWSIMERALEKLEADEEIEKDDEGWAEWELEILKKWPDQSKVAL